MPNSLAQRVEATLRPVIGSVLASVSVDVESKRIGKTSDTIEPSDLEPISRNIAATLRLVVGQELAEAAAERVRQLR